MYDYTVIVKTGIKCQIRYARKLNLVTIQQERCLLWLAERPGQVTSYFLVFNHEYIIFMMMKAITKHRKE